MTIKTGLELFNSVWLIESQSALNYLQMWEMHMKNPEGRIFQKQETDETKALDLSKFLSADNSVHYAPVDLWSDAADNFTGFDGATVVVIAVEGPLMKNDYCGIAGTDTLANFFKLANKTESVKTIIMLYNTPGGTVAGTANFAATIAEKTKKVISVVTGMCCSAGYWLASQGDEIIATSATDIIGSIGTMASWYDRSKYLAENGIILREFTATASQDKNKAFKEANEGRGKLLVESMLDPLNDEFIADVLRGRSGKISAEENDVLTGKTFTAKPAKANGLIDDIKPFDLILEQATPKQKINSPFSMKNFKNVIAAAGVESVYAEDKFFGLSEDQLEKVEASFQQMADAAATVGTSIKKFGEDLEAAKADHKKTTDELTTANGTIKTLQDEVAALKKLDGSKPSATSKENDDKPLEVAKTSVDEWWENLNS